MAGRDPLQDLRDLAEFGERAARPTAPAEIRSRGERRGRRRRAGAAVVTLVVAVLAGAVGIRVASPSLLPDLSQPAAPPTVGPTASARPTSALAEGNLVQPEDLPVRQGQQAEQFDRRARPDQRPSACFAERLGTLGPTDLRIRSFRYVVTDPDVSPDTDDPLYEQPTVYTGALQFVDEAAAEVAYQKLSGWIEDCADALDAKVSARPAADRSAASTAGIRSAATSTPPGSPSSPTSGGTCRTAPATSRPSGWFASATG